MDVYVLQIWGWDDHPIAGVYSSLEAAMAATGKVTKWEQKSDRRWYAAQSPRSWAIERWPLQDSPEFSSK